MLSINQKDPNPPIKVYLDKHKDDEKRAFLMLRPATELILSEIREKTHTKKFKKVSRKIHEYYEVDEDLYDLLLWGYCLPGWGNLVDENGNQIKYSNEKAIWLIKHSPFFSDKVGEKLDEVKDIIENRAKDIEGN